ncbi:MAG: alpha/beta hydrolase [Pseudomonadota bacterium]
MSAMTSISTTAAAESELAEKQTEDCVILLHGLARTSRSMRKIAHVLKDDYRVINQGYPSRKHPIETLAELAIPPALKQCTGGGNIHFVTHSLGGILVRQYLHNNEIPMLGNTVMLGPPNQGSELADQLSGNPIVDYYNGPAGKQLGTDPNSVPIKLGAVNFTVGVIAGNKNFRPSFAEVFPGDHDGKVSVARSKVDGLTDHLVLPVTHTFMMRNDLVIAQIQAFLRDGKFAPLTPKDTTAQPKEN